MSILSDHPIISLLIIASIICVFIEFIVMITLKSNTSMKRFVLKGNKFVSHLNMLLPVYFSFLLRQV